MVDDAMDVAGLVRQAVGARDPGVALRAGLILCNGGRYAEALGAFARVVELNPEDRVGWNNLGLVLANQGRMGEAVECLRRACVPPANVEHFVNLGATLMHLGKWREAGEVLARVVEATPEDRFAWKNLGVVRQEQARVEEAVECLRRACGPPTAPSDPTYQSNLVYASLFHPRMTPEEVFAEHLEWDRRHGVPRHRRTPHRNERSAGRRLRVGYLSANFHDHAVMVFLEPVLAHHDHERFEVLCYAASNVEDATTQRLRGYADGWRSLVGLSDSQAAELIEGDGVDVLVDMAEHMSGVCSVIVARQPAPVQVTWCYPYSSGQSAMNYRLTDAHADPVGQTERFNSETLIRLPGSYYCYLPPGESPGVNEAPCAKHGYVTFGSMNQVPKLSQRVVGVWAEVLKRVPTSRLAMLAPGGVEENGHIVEWFARCGVDSGRIELLPRVPRGEFLKHFHRMDLALDPFPCVGHTTSCESLWMGVPFITLAGVTAVERMGVSVLENVGVAGWIARTEEEYVRLAVEWAGKPLELARLRGELRGRMQGSRLMDYAGVTRDVEGAYREGWRRWCARST